MKTRNLSTDVFFDLHWWGKMVSNGSIGTVCGRTKKHIILGLTDDSGVPYSLINFDVEYLGSDEFTSYCYILPDTSLLVENWVRDQYRANFLYNVAIAAAIITELFTLLILGVL